MINEGMVCNGRAITVPILETIRSEPAMSIGSNIDWLLHIYYTRRDFERCKQFIERELCQHLNPEYLYFIKALIDREEGNNIEALRNLQNALELNSKNIEIYKEMGKTLYMMGRYKESLNVFREAEQLSTRFDHEIYHYIGELLLRSANSRNRLELMEQQQEQNEAKEYFQKAVQTGKKMESFQRLAEIYRKEHDYAKAIEILENCLLLSPENTDVLTEIAVLHLKLNDTQKAFDRLLEVIQFDKKCLRGLMAYATILQSRNDIDAALSKYKEIAILKPDIPELWNNIGLCFFKKRKLILAISSLRKALWLSPLNYNALYNLSIICINAKQYASAFHALATAINLRKDNSECFMLLGLCLRKLDDFDNAYVAFERANALEMAIPTNKLHQGYGNPLIHLNYALFCYETGRLNTAIEQYHLFMKQAENLKSIPTDYKFQATKLKTLLKIISNDDLLVRTVKLKDDAAISYSNDGNNDDTKANANANAMDSNNASASARARASVSAILSTSQQNLNKIRSIPEGNDHHNDYDKDNKADNDNDSDANNDAEEN